MIKFSYLCLFLVLLSCHQEERQKISFEGIKNFDLDNVLKVSQETGKPILFYFSSIACVNCRKLEMSFNRNNDITKKMQDDFIFVTLMVDDGTVVDEKRWKQHPRRKTKSLKTVGALNNELQFELTRYGSQPVFAIVNDKKETLSIIGYSTMSEFSEFLNETH